MVKLAMGVGKPTGADASAALSAAAFAAPSARPDIAGEPVPTLSAVGTFLGSLASGWLDRWPGALALPGAALATFFKMGAFAGALAGRAMTAFAVGFAAAVAVLRSGVAALLRVLPASLLAGLAGFRAAFALLPALATFVTFVALPFAVFGLAARRPAGTGFRFGAVFAFRI